MRLDVLSQSTDERVNSLAVVAWPGVGLEVMGCARTWQSRVGFGHVTTVRVVQYRVVERRFEAFTSEFPQASWAKTVQDSWLEQGSPVGSRAGSAAAALTLDELYGVCRRLLNEPRVAFAGPQPQWQPPVLTLDHRGVLQSCQSTLAKVMGDAPQRGVPALELHLDK